jgi:hypothetical protein
LKLAVLTDLRVSPTTSHPELDSGSDDRWLRGVLDDRGAVPELLCSLEKAVVVWAYPESGSE